MSRNENQDVSHMNLPDPNVTEIRYFLPNGEIIDKEEYDKQGKVCAKEIFNKDTHILSYYILCAGSLMFDPRELKQNCRYLSRNRWVFRRVKRSTFDLYTKFLKQQYTSFLHQAEREL